MGEKSGNYHGLIERNDCLVVLIDLQEKLLPVISDKNRLIDNAARIAEFSSICGIPVLLTEQQKLGPTLDVIKKHLRGTDPIGKIHFNCFFNDHFKESVEAAGRKTLIIAGVEAHICVAQTALYSLKDYRVHVIGDAVSSRSTENREFALQRMRDAGVVISSTEMFIYEVLVKAGTDEFKAVLPLVK